MLSGLVLTFQKENAPCDVGIFTPKLSHTPQ